MTIDDLLKNRISPFDTGDTKLTKLFNYFLYDSPTLETAGLGLKKAMNKTTLSEEICVTDAYADDEARRTELQLHWDSFIAEMGDNPHVIYASSYRNFTNACDKIGLGNSSVLSRRFKGFICKKNDQKPPETDYACVLRHLRNAIAHMNVFMVHAGNRMYILFEDYNARKNLTARLLFTQSDLEKLKKTMGR